MIRRLLELLCVSGLCWAVLAYPAWLGWGNRALADSTTAMLLCLLPAAITLVGGLCVLRRAPELLLLLICGSMGLRIFLVLGGGMLLWRARAEAREPGFWLWVLFFYLFTLAVETWLMLADQARTGLAAMGRRHLAGR